MFARRLLPSEASDVAGVIEKVIAPISEAPSAMVEVEVSISVREAISIKKEKEPSDAVVNIEKEMEPSPIPISKAMMTESISEPLASVLETMVTDQ